jgi:hypothetical protein
MNRNARFAPVLRFILEDTERRESRVERMCYLGGIDGWLHTGRAGRIADLAAQVVPALSTNAFFELNLL